MTEKQNRRFTMQSLIMITYLPAHVVPLGYLGTPTRHLLCFHRTSISALRPVMLVRPSHFDNSLDTRRAGLRMGKCWAGHSVIFHADYFSTNPGPPFVRWAWVGCSCGQSRPCFVSFWCTLLSPQHWQVLCIVVARLDSSTPTRYGTYTYIAS